MFDTEDENLDTFMQVSNLPAGMTIVAVDAEGRFVETSQVDFEASVEDFKGGLQDAVEFIRKHQRSCTFQIRGE